MNKDGLLTVIGNTKEEIKNITNLGSNSYSINKTVVVIEKQSYSDKKYIEINNIDQKIKNDMDVPIKKSNSSALSNGNATNKQKKVIIKKYITKKSAIIKKLNIEDIPEKMKKIMEENKREERRIIFNNAKNYFLNEKESNKSNIKKSKSPKTTLSNFNKQEKKIDSCQNSKWKTQLKLDSILFKKSLSQEIKLYQNKNQKIKIQYCHGDSLAGLNDDGSVKINQDSFIIKQNINNIENYNLFGVLDGHGKDGHLVSQFCKETIYNKLKNHPLLQKKDIDFLYKQLKKENYKLIENIFLETDKEIKNQNLDFNKSGTTCIIIIQLGIHLICANVGDSRSILIKNNQIILLSTDCKPDIPKEYNRIIENGGNIQCEVILNGKVFGPLRIYEKGKTYPGIAMSRSLGDYNSKKVGVIPNPLFYEHKINNDIKYILVCSDGVWEFISNEEAMKICEKYYQLKDVCGLCKELINVSRESWKKNKVMSDDITVIAVFY